MTNLMEEGDKCPEKDCTGHFEITRYDPCSCHIDPPCAACVDAPIVCSKCGLNVEDT